MSIRVTVTDLETGESEQATVQDGDYLLLTTGSCYVDGIQTYRSGQTHVITVKGRTADGQAAGSREGDGDE